MEFIKKHYEKILFCLVLAGLVGALVFMPFYIKSDTENQEEQKNARSNPPVKALTNLDLTAQNNTIQRLNSDYALDLDTTNKLFNPVDWQKGPDGWVKASQMGIGAAVVTNITPLYLILTLDSVITNEFGARYVIGVEKQAEKQTAKRHKQQHYVSKGDKPNDTFSLEEIKGAPENPDALELKLVDTGDIVIISRDKPFRRVDAYAADFRYDPEKKVFHGRRVGDRVSFGGGEYAVTGVSTYELILSDLSNQKKNTLPFTP
jgi:hypothetical protein